jgi:hypothetical protein
MENPLKLCQPFSLQNADVLLGAKPVDCMPSNRSKAYTKGGSL